MAFLPPLSVVGSMCSRRLAPGPAGSRAAVLGGLLAALLAAFLAAPRGASAARADDPPAAPAAAPTSPTSPAATAAVVPVAVDERVELLTIIARLAGADEYRMPNSASPYAERVAARFDRFRDHAAVAAYRRIRADFGASFDAIPSLALHLDSVERLEERLPFESAPPRLDERWDRTATGAFLVALRAFVQESDATGFFAGERDFYRRCAERMAPVLGQAHAIEWFDGFFGRRPGASYQVIPGLLCGGGNYGVGVRFPDGRPEEIRPVLGIFRWDAEGLPDYRTDDVDTYVHELCHSYTNAIVDRHLDDLAAPAQRLFALVAPRMQRMAYSTWQTAMYETFVRACVVRYLAEVVSPAAATAQSKREASNGFLWVPAVAERLAAYSADRRTTPTFEAFVPEIVAVLASEADRLEASEAVRKAHAPTIVEMTPANGAADVAADRTTLVIRFDRRMETTTWSFVGGKADVPEIVGRPAFDAAGTTLTATVRLVPGRQYHFWLNSERFQGFRAADGTPLEPVEVRFAVRP